MKFLFVASFFLATTWLSQSAYAEGLTIKQGDSIQKILEERKGKQVTLRLINGEEMSGKVRSITKELVLLGELSGRDYYDGIIDIGKISALIIRVKD